MNIASIWRNNILVLVEMTKSTLKNTQILSIYHIHVLCDYLYEQEVA